VSGRRIRAVIAKEWADLRANRSVLVTSIVLPALLTVIFVAIHVVVMRAGGDPRQRPMPLPPELAGLGPVRGILALIGEQFRVLLLIVPSSLPSVIAAFAVVGEKEARSLEPLLATPITTFELLFAKAVSCLVPSVLLGWTAYAVTCVAVRIVAGPELFALAVRPAWTLAMLLAAPLLALLSTMLTLIASSRFNDPRAAQSVTVVFILPLVGGGMTLFVARTLLRLDVLLWVTAVLFVLDVLLSSIATRVFAREHILTRWK